MPDPGTIALAAGGGLAGSAIADKLDSSDDDMLKMLATLNANIAVFAHYNAVQRERTLYPINLNPGKVLTVPGQLRVEFLLTSGAPGDELSFKSGTANLFSWVNVSGDPTVFPFPLLLTGDISIVNVSDPTDVTWRATLFAVQDVGLGISRER